MRKTAVTIKEIAKIAQVSRGTVDRALHDRDGVREDVAKKIKQIAKELSYKPNPVAKALAGSQKHIEIKAIINSGENPFFLPLLKGIENATNAIMLQNLSVNLKKLTGYSVSQQLKEIKLAIEEGVDGLIITPINDRLIIDELNKADKAGIKITTVNADVSNIEKLCFVGCNYFKSGQIAGELMGKMALPKTKVAIVSGAKNMQGHAKRVEGFINALAAENVSLNFLGVVYGEDSDKKTYAKTKEMINKGAEAIYFCAGGIDGGMKAITEETDRKILVITVDDTQNIHRYIQDGIVSATICQEPYKQGYDAVMSQYNWHFKGEKPQKQYIYTDNIIKMKYNL